MKIKIIIFNLIFIIAGCVYEPPPVFYYFSIINNTNQILYIESETIDDSYMKYDTLFAGQEVNRKIVEMQCYDDYYKDSLVATFFKKINITTKDKKITIDPFKRINWNEKLDLKGNSCKYGNVYYKLEIYSKYFQNY